MEHEKKLLASLDAMGWEEWLAMVRWAAETLCRENPSLLIEIIFRRGVKRWEELKVPDDGFARIERVALTFGDVGVKLTTT